MGGQQLRLLAFSYVAEIPRKYRSRVLSKHCLQSILRISQIYCVFLADQVEIGSYAGKNSDRR